MLDAHSTIVEAVLVHGNNILRAELVAYCAQSLEPESKALIGKRIAVLPGDHRVAHDPYQTYIERFHPVDRAAHTIHGRAEVFFLEADAPVGDRRPKAGDANIARLERMDHMPKGSLIEIVNVGSVDGSSLDILPAEGLRYLDLCFD